MDILTWNMQGYNSMLGEKPVLLSKLLNTGKYDVICLQEATKPLGRFQYVGVNNGVEIYKMSPSKRPQREVSHIDSYTALYYEWGTTNVRCSLVTYVKNFAVALNQCGMLNDNHHPQARQMLCVSHNGYNIGNIHLISGCPNVAIQQFNNFRAMMPAGAPYCIVGDYNIDALTDPHVKGVNGFVHVKMPTQLSGACLDYMYANFAPIRCQRLDEPGCYSDHSPVEYEL